MKVLALKKLLIRRGTVGGLTWGFPLAEGRLAGIPNPDKSREIYAEGWPVGGWMQGGGGSPCVLAEL